MKFVMLKVQGYKLNAKRISLKSSKEIYRQLPGYFCVDVIIDNIQERDRMRFKHTKET